MTTNANKFGLRKAAQERSNRHAQRTPLPPRSGVVEAAREPVEALDAKSWGKSKELAALASSLEWEVYTAEQGGTVELTATRGAETIVQAWVNGVWQYDSSVYAYGDRSTKPRNASGARKLLARSEDEASAEMNRVLANNSFRKREPADLANARPVLPFDPENASDEEVAGILAGQGVVWYNRISRAKESAIVGRSGVRFTFLKDGSRVANICCPVSGFRSFLVTALLQVGRGRNATTKGAEFASVELENAA